MEENQSNQQSDYEIKKQQKLKEEQLIQRRGAVRRWVKIIFITILVAGPIIGLIWYETTLPQLPESEVISKNGLHWHPELTIEINGQKQEIQTNIGLMGAVHNPIHTHDDTGTIHLEMMGLVKKDDIKLGQFFKVWNKQFNPNCIFDFCAGEGKMVKMTVNGQENIEFENYQMKDKDKIEIKYE